MSAGPRPAGAPGRPRRRATTARSRCARATPRGSGSLRQGLGWRAEGLLALELAALCGLAFARPVLDTFGRSPETFVARARRGRRRGGLRGGGAAGAAAGAGRRGRSGAAFGRPCAGWPHLALVVVVAASPSGSSATDVTGYRPDGAEADDRRRRRRRWRSGCAAVGGRPAGAFLRVAGVLSVVFLVQFLVLSPTSELVIGDGPPASTDEVAASVSAALGDDPPDVVVVVLDALPTQTLLDGEGSVDAELFPNFAPRRHLDLVPRHHDGRDVHPQAVPAILTGRFRPRQPARQHARRRPREPLHPAGRQLRPARPRADHPALPRATCAPRPASAAGSARCWATPSTLVAGRGRRRRLGGRVRCPRCSTTTGSPRPRSGSTRCPAPPRAAAPAADLHFHHVPCPTTPGSTSPRRHAVYVSRALPRRLRWDRAGTARASAWASSATCCRPRRPTPARPPARPPAGLGALDDTMVVVTADHGHAFVPGRRGGASPSENTRS